jgi:hypothetical protein
MGRLLEQFKLDISAERRKQADTAPGKSAIPVPVVCPNALIK